LVTARRLLYFATSTSHHRTFVQQPPASFATPTTEGHRALHDIYNIREHGETYCRSKKQTEEQEKDWAHLAATPTAPDRSSGIRYRLHGTYINRNHGGFNRDPREDTRPDSGCQSQTL